MLLVEAVLMVILGSGALVVVWMLVVEGRGASGSVPVGIKGKGSRVVSGGVDVGSRDGSGSIGAVMVMLVVMLILVVELVVSRVGGGGGPADVASRDSG